MRDDGAYLGVYAQHLATMAQAEHRRGRELASEARGLLRDLKRQVEDFRLLNERAREYNEKAVEEMRVITSD